MYPMTLILFTFVFFFLHHLILTTAADDIAVNCGSSGTSIALDGRQWVGDMDSRSTFSRQPKGKSIRSKALAPQSLMADPIPYMTAWISASQFACTFRVSPGQKFIRLHFYPASYPGFERSKAFFTVKAGPYTLLSNFSASLAADALGLKSFAKEFCVNFEENQELTISFSPSPTRASDSVYAFVNGIEIISMPSGLYYTPDGELGVQVVGQKHRFPIDNSTALELVERLNVGGSSILPGEDQAMFRRWSGDSNYLIEPPGLLLTTMPIPVKYTKIPTYSAPQKVYQTAWSVDPNKHANKMCNLTWKLPLDLGFRYLVRLHFCELDLEVKESGQKEFVIFINNKIVEARVDEERVAVYRDYMVKMDGNWMKGKSYLLITLQSHHYTIAVLNGIEVFKLSNPDNILAGQNPEPLAHAFTSSTAQKLQNLQLALGNWNAVVSCLIILLTSLNIIVYRLRLWVENVGQIDISIIPKSEDLCRHFSLVEIQVATNNFDEALIIGEGGFGKVYKGVINKGATIVAVKRLRSMSKQGAQEFWTEIEMLSNLRHTHLVTLIGYCNDGGEMILVYEYMVNGTLADHLHKISRKCNGSIPPLSWEQRLNICIGAAVGLEYLHTGAQHRVIHRDVKTSNILLDENWVAKISDFGLSKMGGTSTTNQSSTCIITEVKGTFGYLDVEYFLTHRLTRKSDVYAFGVVLFEVLCGRPAVDKRFEGEERSLALWAQRCIKERELDQIIDPTIKGQISPHCLKMFVEIANKCLHNRPNERPRMSHVVQRLEFALILQGHSAYSSTDTDGEEEKLIGVSMDVNMPIDSIIEEEEVEKVINETTPSTNSQQLTDFTVSLQDSTDRPEERANRKMFSIRSAFKGMNLWRRKKNGNNLSSSGSINEAKISQTEAKTSQVLPGKPCLAEFLLEPPCRIFSLQEIKEATKNFRRDLIIRHGGPDGEMYRGYIDNGELPVAIERCTRESESNFLQEVELRSRLHHQHLISFIGYCKDFGETNLVYEYMAKGSLGDYLHGMGIDPLPWKKRLEICLGSAQALQYLHTCSLQPIIHGELTSSSIWLDEKWVAKVSGLKASELDPTNSRDTRTVVTTVIRKTLGYVDPEYLLSGRLTTKSDVYSFGVVLLEVLCGREPQCPDQVKEKRNLVEWFKICIQKKKIDEVIDPYLMGKVAPHSLKEYVRIADKCLLFRGVERPLMDDVVRRLQLALKQQEKAGEFIKFGVFGDPRQTSIAAATNAYNKVLLPNEYFGGKIRR